MVAEFSTPRVEPIPDLVSIDCPVPTETTCATFADPVGMARHLLEEHQAWEVAQVAARLSIQVDYLYDAVDRVSQAATNGAEELADSWFPIRMVDWDGNEVPDRGTGAMDGLKPVLGTVAEE